jgi:hypothetical protein
MNSISVRNHQAINWSTIVLFVLGFWLSSSLILDCLVIPGLFTTGMMNQSGFASASYVIFGTFNRLELLAAAIALTGCLVFRHQHYFSRWQEVWSLILAAILMAIALVYTYILTPEMSSLGLSLELANPLARDFNAMTMMHGIYWGLEITKLIISAVLLRWFYRSSCTLV